MAKKQCQNQKFTFIFHHVLFIKSKFLVLALLLSHGQSINLTLKSKNGMKIKHIEDDLD
jgi:hypothetical protein